MLKSSMNARAVARTCVATTSADVGEVALVGVPLIDRPPPALAEGRGDSAGLGDGVSLAAMGELGAVTGEAERGSALALSSALGWLTFAEQAASNAMQSGSERRVPRRYPTGGGYGRPDA
jgi:hypothetical protein